MSKFKYIVTCDLSRLEVCLNEGYELVSTNPARIEKAYLSQGPTFVTNTVYILRKAKDE